MLKIHKWKYRNPYSRSCEICGEEQDVYCMAWDLWVPGRGWWEVMKPSNKACRRLGFRLFYSWVFGDKTPSV